jgi:GNAT superfamily N-acetyltransferase
LTEPQARGWSVRHGRAEDLEAIRDLYREVWGYQRPASFDRWRYLTPPDGLCPTAVAVDGAQLAGAYLIWPAKIRIGDDVVLGAQSMDTMTHPAYQGQGVFTKLAEACFALAETRGFRVLYGFPNSASYPGFVRRLGWTHTGNVTHWIRAIRPSRHPKVPPFARGVLDAVAGLLPKGRRAGFEIVAGILPSSALVTLLDAWSRAPGACQIERTPEWLAWRYDDAAQNAYRWLGAYRGGTLAAAAVWGMRTPAWGDIADGRAHLVELLGSDPSALSAVLASVIDETRSAGAVLLETLCNIERLSPVLRRAGFLRHRKAPMIVKVLGAAALPVDALDHTHWRIMGSDVDTF